jgi:hypothetical protein
MLDALLRRLGWRKRDEPAPKAKAEVKASRSFCVDADGRIAGFELFANDGESCISLNAEQFAIGQISAAREAQQTHHIIPQSEIDDLERETYAMIARFEAMIAERDRVIEVIANQPDRSRKAVQVARNFLMRRELTS